MCTIPTGTITFDEKRIDNTNSFNETTGIFTAPTEGTYVFFVNAFVNTYSPEPNSESGINVYMNGHAIKYFFDDEDAGNRRQLNFFFQYHMYKNNQLWMKNLHGDNIFVGYLNPLTLLGFLM